MGIKGNQLETGRVLSQVGNGQSNRIIIHGANAIGRNLMRYLDACGYPYELLCFLDDDPHLHYKGFEGYQVRPLAEVVFLPYDRIFIAGGRTNELAYELDALGVDLTSVSACYPWQPV